MNVFLVAAISVISTLVIIFLIRFIIGVRESQKQVKNNIIDIESIKTELSVIHDRISNVAEEIYQGMNVERDNQTRELDRRFERVYKKMGKTE
jgi:biopolymer transport protein ExbB/TolQ